MGVFWCLPLILFLLHQASTDRGAEETRAVGTSVTFHLGSLDGEAVAWNFHNSPLVTVTFGNPPQPVYFNANYKPRLSFPEQGSALTISQLGLEDSGTYTAKTTRGQTFTFTLHVYREVSVPTVTCLARNCSATSCLYALRCSTSGPGSGHVSYSWSSGGWPHGEGPMVLLEESSSEQLLTCTAQNPVSSRNVTVGSPAALCTGTYSTRQGGIVAGAVIGTVVLLAAITFMIYCKTKGWNIFRVPVAEAVNTDDGTEYATVYAQVGPPQQVEMHSLSDAQQDVPKKTLPPDVESSKTIYFTIQPMSQTDDEKMGNSTLECHEQEEKSLYASVGRPGPTAQP